MNEQLLSSLEAEIDRTEAELRVKKVLLHQLKKKPEVPFIQSRFGRGYLKTLRFIALPGARLFQLANQAIENPEEYLAESDLNEARRVLEQCEAMDSNDLKKAAHMAVRAAQARITLDRWTDLENVGAVVNLLQDKLHDQVMRLRQDKSDIGDSHVKEVMEQLKSVAQGLGIQTVK